MWPSREGSVGTGALESLEPTRCCCFCSCNILTHGDSYLQRRDTKLQQLLCNNADTDQWQKCSTALRYPPGVASHTCDLTYHRQLGLCCWRYGLLISTAAVHGSLRTQRDSLFPSLPRHPFFFLSLTRAFLVTCHFGLHDFCHSFK